MVLRRRTLVLYFLFIFLLQHNFPSVSSRPSSVDTNHEALPLEASKPDVVGFEVKAPELHFIIKKRRGGGGGRGNDGGGRRVTPSHPGGGGGIGGPHRSSGSRNFRGAVCAVGWLGLSVLSGLLFV